MNYLKLNRRAFIRSLGLGAGAYILNPIAGTLFSEAYGQSTTAGPKLIIGVLGEGFGWCFHPPEHRKELGAGNNIHVPMSGLTWPSCFSSLSRFKDNAILVERFHLPGETGAVHGQGWSTLSAQLALTSPKAATFEHLMADKLKAGTPLPVIRWGYTEDKNDGTSFNEKTTIFARASGQAISHTTKFTPLKNQLFAGGGAQLPAESITRREALMAFLKDDANKLRRKLASQEREKLDSYLEGVAEFERSQAGSCSAGQLASTFEHQEDEFLEMAKMVGYAMSCGMSNISAFGVATEGVGHGNYPKFHRLLRGGSGPHNAAGFAAVYHPKMMGIMAQAMDIILRTISGGESLPADTTLMLMPSNGIGDWHHGNRKRFPVLIVSSNKNLRTGHYRVFPQNVPLGALYVTVAKALGVQLPGFGAYTGAPIKELLT